MLPGWSLTTGILFSPALVCALPCLHQSSHEDANSLEPCCPHAAPLGCAPAQSRCHAATAVLAREGARAAGCCTPRCAVTSLLLRAAATASCSLSANPHPPRLGNCVLPGTTNWRRVARHPPACPYIVPAAHRACSPLLTPTHPVDAGRFKCTRTAPMRSRSSEAKSARRLPSPDSSRGRGRPNQPSPGQLCAAPCV